MYIRTFVRTYVYICLSMELLLAFWFSPFFYEETIDSLFRCVSNFVLSVAVVFGGLPDCLPNEGGCAWLGY